ncbi:glutamyl-tRNA reductase [Marinicella sp. S1101]|uniref:glutamyl-tRNA reductase n=1 Tax=Marinicella marina TaxID=2996016 RepID=UPI00226085F9|nr:glutamyl-tRNA reductase [Marinicella marina]MCX7554127.1 glutamyl-tRNA reductase [Marinicella marina]MDJ1141180.1 glutamyl-tRNA reductase [Marinicella marina]
MAICVLGINHKTAELKIRERFSIPESNYKSHLEKLISSELIDSAVVISTCNRTEFYLSTSTLDCLKKEAENVLGFATDIDSVYTKTGHDCAAHLFAVTAGVDSLVVGETQIQGQVKRAFDEASQLGLNGEINKLFQMAFKTAKLVRSDTEIGRNPVSVAHCAVQLGRQIFGSLQQQNVLIVGAGETAELLIRYLINHNAKNITIANRTTKNAKKMANIFQAEVIELAEIESHLSEFDLVFTATASPQQLITRKATEEAIKLRKYKPMVMIDLSVPRDIDEQIKLMDDVFLYAVDDLQKVITENMQRRENTISEAKRIIKAEAELLDQWIKSQQHHNLLKQYQQKVDGIKTTVLAKQIKASTPDDEAKKYQNLAHQVAKKLSHDNISGIRKIIESGNEEHIKLIADLFNLELNDES